MTYMEIRIAIDNRIRELKQLIKNSNDQDEKVKAMRELSLCLKLLGK